MVVAMMLVGSLAAAALPCESLKALARPDMTITVAELVPAGPYTPPAPAGDGRGGRGQAPAPAIMLPAHCRVAATLKPSNDSDVEMEVWMPAEELERQVPGGRQRGLGRRHQLSGDGCGAARGLRHRVHRHRTQRRQRGVRHRASRETDRLRLSRRSRNGGDIEALSSSVLRARAAPLVLERLLDRRTPGADVGAEVSGRLRRDSGRRAGELPDAPAHAGT